MTHVPSPADMATRTRRVLAVRSPDPVGSAKAPRFTQVPADASWRTRWDHAVKHSRMAPNTRLVALMAATWADPVTGDIPPGQSPGQSALADACGLSQGNVRHALGQLRARGFITRTSPPGGTSVRMVLHIPPTAPTR